MAGRVLGRLFDQISTDGGWREVENPKESDFAHYINEARLDYSIAH